MKNVIGKLWEYPNHYRMKKARLALIKKYGKKCQKCGEYCELIHFHHKDKTNYNHSASNGMLLCHVCHKKIHGYRHRTPHEYYLENKEKIKQRSRLYSRNNYKKKQNIDGK